MLNQLRFPSLSLYTDTTNVRLLVHIVYRSKQQKETSIIKTTIIKTQKYIGPSDAGQNLLKRTKLYCTVASLCHYSVGYG